RIDVGDVLMGPAALPQADDEDAVLDLGVGFLAEGLIELCDFLGRQADADHVRSVPGGSRRGAFSLYAPDRLIEHLYHTLAFHGGAQEAAGPTEQLPDPGR